MGTNSATLALQPFGQSKVNAYIRCPWAYYQTYEADPPLEHDSKSAMRGRLIHRGIECCLKRKPFKPWDDDHCSKPGRPSVRHDWANFAESDDRELILHCVGRATDYIKTIFDKIEHVEYGFSWTYGTQKWHGTADLIARRKSDGSRWMVDYKTVARMNPTGYYEPQIQAPLYLYGVPLVIDGWAQLQIRWGRPQPPRITKTGKLSKNQTNSDRTTFLAGLREAGIDVTSPEARAALARLKPYDQIDYYRFSTPVIDATMQEASHIAHFISTNRIMGSSAFRRNMHPTNCNHCPLFDACRTDLYQQGKLCQSKH